MAMKKLLCLLAGMLLASSAQAWWDEAFAGRKEIEINTSATGINLTGPVDQPSVLLRLHAGNFPEFLAVSPGGADFRVLAGDDLTPLPMFVEKFDPTAQIALVWARLPAISNLEPAKVFLYYNNPTAANASQPAGIFDDKVAAVFHFDDAASGTAADAVGKGSQILSGTYFGNPASIIGTGATLAGTDALVVLDPTAQLGGDGWSFEGWFKLPAPGTSNAVLAEHATSQGPLRVAVSPEGTLSLSLGAESVQAAVAFQAGAWQHVAVSMSAEALDLYLGGEKVASLPVSGVLPEGNLFLGGAADGTGLSALELDEVRIHATARTPDWFRFTATVEGERNDAVVTYAVSEAGEGGAEEGGHGGGGHFATIWYSVFGPGGPMIERVVIIACGLLMLVALAVMFFKTILLSRARSATTRFEKAFKQLKVGATEADGQLGALVNRQKKFGDSPLFRVYVAALQSLSERQASRSVGAGAVGLDAKAIKAIQASMDTVMVRQSQRLNSYMVLLTIAISGGPFIGLLGTVVGVMTTFGAIAATGDINITAIAPGMAAALLATVAGLGVAIPALFGYNYLGSKIKELSADMSVFSDELTARIAEEFGA